MFRFTLTTMYRPEEIRTILQNQTDSSKEKFLSDFKRKDKLFRGEVRSMSFKLRPNEILPGQKNYYIKGTIEPSAYPTRVNISITSTAAKLFGILFIACLGFLFYMYVSVNEIFTPIALPILIAVGIHLRLFFSYLKEKKRFTNILTKQPAQNYNPVNS